MGAFIALIVVALFGTALLVYFHKTDNSKAEEVY